MDRELDKVGWLLGCGMKPNTMLPSLLKRVRCPVCERPASIMSECVFIYLLSAEWLCFVLVFCQKCIHPWRLERNLCVNKQIGFDDFPQSHICESVCFALTMVNSRLSESATKCTCNHKFGWSTGAENLLLYAQRFDNSIGVQLHFDAYDILVYALLITISQRP